MITCLRLYFWNFSRCARLICVSHAVKTAAGCSCHFERTKYCDRVCDEDTGASCKEVAAREKYAAQVKADRARQLYQQLRNKYQMHCAYAQGNAKMREAYNKWRDPRRRQWSNTR